MDELLARKALGLKRRNIKQELRAFREFLEAAVGEMNLH